MGTIGPARACSFCAGLGNDDGFLTGWALNFGTGSGSIDLKFLVTIWAIEDDVHKTSVIATAKAE
jgi:hypothetical protein